MDSTPEGSLSSEDTAAWKNAARQIGNGCLSIIMPVHNLRQTAAANLREVHDCFSGKIPFEIIAVDDGSTDGTREAIESIQPLLPSLRVITQRENSGKGVTLIRGFESSRGSHILFLDGDLDLSPRHVPSLFAAMQEQNADIVIGSKQHPESSVHAYPWHRRLTSTVYYRIVRLLLDLPVRDTQTGIKLFKRQVLEWVCPRLLVKRFAFDLELLAVAHEKGFRIAETPVTLRASARWNMVSPTAVRQVMNDTLAVFYRIRILQYYKGLPNPELPNPPPRVSVIIAYPRPSSCLEECLAGLAVQTVPPDEIILLPDTPSERNWPGPIREISTGILRPAEKRNIGIQHARGDIIACLDDDAFPGEEWLRRALVYFADPQTAAVGGPATTPRNDSFLARISGDVFANRLVSGQHRLRYVPTRVQEVEDLPSCNLLVRKTILQELRGFRTDFWPGEDTYLCMEIVKRLGKKIIYDPRVHVFHHRRRMFFPHLRQISRYALHRGYFARRFPETSFKLSYMLPSLFIFGLLAGGGLSLAFTPIRTLYFAAVWTYLLLTFLSCATWHPGIWFLRWVGVFLTHVVYGVRFLAGLCTLQLPDEVRRFDHPSEKSGVAP